MQFMMMVKAAPAYKAGACEGECEIRPMFHPPNCGAHD